MHLSMMKIRKASLAPLVPQGAERVAKVEARKEEREKVPVEGTLHDPNQEDQTPAKAKENGRYRFADSTIKDLAGMATGAGTSTQNHAPSLHKEAAKREIHAICLMKRQMQL